MSETNTVERPVMQPKPERDDFRALIDWHRVRGTCYVCELPVDASQGYHGVTGAHWDCVKTEEKKTEEAFSRADQGFRELGFKPRRKREGEGAIAQKCKAMAVTALQEALGVSIYKVTMWNQQGSYRGPRRDLDSWGVGFWFEVDGREFSGSASSLSTMTQCVHEFKRLKASREDVSHTFSLWEYSKPHNAEVSGPSTRPPG